MEFATTLAEDGNCEGSNLILLEKIKNTVSFDTVFLLGSG